MQTIILQYLTTLSSKPPYFRDRESMVEMDTHGFGSPQFYQIYSHCAFKILSYACQAFSSPHIYISSKNQPSKWSTSGFLRNALGGTPTLQVKRRSSAGAKCYSRACLKTRFCLRGSGFLRQGDRVDDETYREYVEQVAVKNPLP